MIHDVRGYVLLHHAFYDKKRGEDGHVGKAAMRMRMGEKTVISTLNRLDMDRIF